MEGLEGLRKEIFEFEKAQRIRMSTSKASIARGQIIGDVVYLHGKSYPYILAVDMNVSNGMYVWCEIYNGQAVIVGA